MTTIGLRYNQGRSWFYETYRHAPIRARQVEGRQRKSHMAHLDELLPAWPMVQVPRLNFVRG